MRVAIIGAGIVGLATAHALLDRGHEVVLIEPGGKQGRPTDGNAGWIAHTDVMPLASPKAWRNLPHLAPWLARFLLASSPSRIKASIGAIRSINAESLPAWKNLLSSLKLDGHLRENGILSVWRHRDDFLRSQDIIERQRGFGIEAQALSPAALGELEPALRNVEAAVLYPEACHVSDPAILAADLLRLALERGALHVAANALQIEPKGETIHVRTDGADQDVAADRVVIAAGIWSRALAAQLGDRIPLDTERGYNEL